MALVVKDRVQESSATTGTGTLTLGGALTGFQSFSSAIGNGNTTYYAITLNSEWEVGIGTVGASTLTRDIILESSNSGSLVNFSAGTKNVFCTYPAEKSLYLDASGNAISLGTPASINLTNATSLPPSQVSDQLNTSTGYFSIPKGTTAQRPASPTSSMTRFNTSVNAFEYYNGTNWQIIYQNTIYPASYLIVAGGGGGGANDGGGGGAGGYLSGSTTLIAGTSYSFVVGAGGAGSSSTSSPNSGGSNGSDSTGFGLTAIGGGGGGGQGGVVGKAGGSGGGGANASTFGVGTSGQGYAGGSGINSGNFPGGGGGGSSAVGQNAPTSSTGGSGGAGTSNSITGSAVIYAGGGGAAVTSGGTAGSGNGGGGNGGVNGSGTAGTANTGGGGGGSSGAATGLSGGSGVVIISIPTTSYTGTTTGSPTVTTSGSNTIIKFTASGSYTA